MNPSTTFTTVRSDLSGAYQETDLERNMAGLIGLEVLRPFSVARQRGIFAVVPIEKLLASCPTERGSNSGYNRSVWSFEDGVYSTMEHGLESPIDSRDLNIYSDLIDAELVTVARLRNNVLSNQERRVAALVQNPSTFTPTPVSVTWRDLDSSDPVADVEAAVNRLYAKGIIANALVITRNQYRELRQNAKLLDKVSSGGAGSSTLPGNVNLDVLRRAFDLPHILVAGGIENSANEGATPVFGGIWNDDYATVTRVAESNDIIEPCLGRTFHWDEDGGAIAGTIEDYWDDSRRARVYRVRHDVQEKIIHSGAAELLENCYDAPTP